MQVIATTKDFSDLWTVVYRLYGYDSSALKVNFTTWQGAALEFSNHNPTLVAVLGSISQTMTLFMSGQALLVQAFANKLPDAAVAAQVRNLHIMILLCALVMVFASQSTTLLDDRTLPCACYRLSIRLTGS
jgi:hypothetical protein